MDEASSRLQKLEADNFRLYQQLQTAVEQSRTMGLELQELRRTVTGGTPPVAAPLPTASAAPAPQPLPPHQPPAPVSPALPPFKMPPPKAARPSLSARWNSDGKGIEKLVAVLGTFITLIGVTLFLIQGTEREWLNKYSHLGIVVALAAGLMVWGNHLIKDGGRLSVKTYDGTSSRNLGALALIATGYAALYIDLVAGVNYYKWLSSPVSVAIATVVILMGLVHALYLNSRIFTLLVVAGSSLLLPFLTQVPQLVFLYLALTVLTLIFYYRKSDSVLTVLRTLPLVAAFVVWRSDDSYKQQVAVFFSAWFIFVVLQYLLPLWQEKRQELTRLPLTLLTFTLLWGVAFTLTADEKKVVTLVALAVAATFSLVAKNFSNTLRTVFFLLALMTGLAAVAAYSTEETTAVFALVAVIISVYLAKRLPSLLGTVVAVGGSVSALGLLAMSGLGIILNNPSTARKYEPSGYVMPPPEMEWQVPVLWALGLVLIATLMWASSMVQKVIPKDFLLVALAAAGLYLWMGFLVTSGFFISYSGTAFIVAHMMTTLSYIVAVVLLLSFSARLPAVWRQFALGLLFVAVAKLFLFDLQALDGLFRVMAFTLTGVILLALNAVGLLGRGKKAPPVASPPPPQTLQPENTEVK